MKRTILRGLAIICILSVGILNACQVKEQTAQEKIEVLRQQFDNIMTEVYQLIKEGPNDVVEQLKLLNQDPIASDMDTLKNIMDQVAELQKGMNGEEKILYHAIYVQMEYEYNVVNELKEAYPKYANMTQREKFLIDMKLQIIKNA